MMGGDLHNGQCASNWHDTRTVFDVLNQSMQMSAECTESVQPGILLGFEKGTEHLLECVLMWLTA